MSTYGTARQLDFTATRSSSWALSPNELLQRCLDAGDREAWEEFVRRYRKPIALVVLRVARSCDESSTMVVDDLVQETFLKLCENDCRILRDFRSQQPQGLPGFLKVLAANLAQDHFRALRATKRGADKTCTSDEALGAVNSEAVDSVEKAILFREIDTFLNDACSAHEMHQAVFWLYYRDGMTAKSIASISGLTTKGVETIIFRLTQQVRSRFGQPSSHHQSNNAG